MTDNEFAISAWDADWTLGWLKERALLPDLPRYAREHEAGLAPCDREWLKKRLSALGLAFGHERDPNRATAWLAEMGRLLMDLPQDILAHAIDEAIKRSAINFMPGVGPIRLIADPLFSQRKQTARRLRVLADMALGRPDQRADADWAPAPEGEDRLLPDQVEEMNGLMQRMGLRTRYRPDGSAYQLAEAEARTAQRDDGARPSAPARQDTASTRLARMPTEADYIALMGKGAWEASRASAGADQ